MPRKSGAKAKADGSLVLSSAQTGPIREVPSTRGAKRRRTSNSTDIYGSGTIVATNPFDDDHQATPITHHQSQHHQTHHNFTSQHPQHLSHNAHQQLHHQQQSLQSPHHHALPHPHHQLQSPTPNHQALPIKHEMQPMMMQQQQQQQHPQMQQHHLQPSNMGGPPMTHSPHQHQTQIFHHPHHPGPPHQASLTPTAQQQQMHLQQQQPQVLHHAQSPSQQQPPGQQSMHHHLAPQAQPHQVYSPANYMQSQQPYPAQDQSQQQQLLGMLYCGKCQREIYQNEQSIVCKAGCQSNYHVPCSGLSQMACDLLMKERDHAEWICDRCSSVQRLPYVKYKS